MIYISLCSITHFNEVFKCGTTNGGLKLNTMQLETPDGNHSCLMANDRIKDWLIHLLILSTVYEYDKH